MRYISSDTNIWLDFDAISSIELPFLLPYTFIMYKEALRKEIISPPSLIKKLKKSGLQTVELELEEFIIADNLSQKYGKLSGYDRIALAIAMNRNIELLTGDGALRKAALAEGVTVLGSIGIMDELLARKSISRNKYRICLEAFLKHPERRLPKDEIEKRLKEVSRH
ncbi:MAG: PIN domain-containing protein [Lachnospiraceae bacterium]|nr:PIN domain-containing protein [Lachnospiraceae bacterium]